MIFNERYEIGIDVDGVEFDASPNNYAFTLHDSIYSFYPTMSLKINDIGGLLNEYLVFINGTKFEVTYGASDNYVSCPYTVVKNALPDQNLNDTMGGISEISLVHEYFYDQNKKSKAYKDEIGNIVKKVSTFNFAKKKVDTTLNKGYWFQPYITDADFIVNYLLPFSVSNDSNKTPYYAFIDIENNLNFRNYKKMLESSYEENLVIYPKGDPKSLGRDSILGFFPYQSSLSEIKDTFFSISHKFDKSASFIVEEEKAKDYIMEGGLNIPLKINPDNTTNIYELYSEDVKDDNIKNNNKGLSLFLKRNLFTFDKVVILCNLNTKLCAGKKVKVTLPTYADPQKTELSARYSGEYIVESSYHSWNGRSGNTTIVLSRQAIKLPSTYRFKEATIK